MERNYSVLIIGCGSIGERHLRCFLRTGRCVITTCDSNPVILEAIAKKYAVRTYADWKSAISSQVFDAAVICTPAQAHVSIATELLRAGLHVLIEKPLSHSLQAVDTLIHTHIQSGKQAAVAYVYHVFPFLSAARQFIRTGSLGPVLQATVRSGQPFNLLRPAYAQTYYRSRQTGGGAIQDALTHLANWMEGVVGPTDSVLCDCAHLALSGVSVEDTVHLSARHGAVLVGYSLNQFQAPNETTIQLDAAQGSLMIEFHHQRWGIFRQGDTSWTWHDMAVHDRDAHFTAQANAFLDQIAGGSSPLCTLEGAAQTLRFNLAALASAETGNRVHCASLHE